MKILIAEDDLVPRYELGRTLQDWGHEVITTCDGLAAWEVLQREDAPKLAILDWMMPLLDGSEVCRRTHGLARREPTYCIILTVKDQKADVVAGLEGGADDYITKPFDRQELRARIRVGERMVALQRGLADRVRELETAVAQVKQLKGLLPICSYCKKIRDGGDYWQQVDAYISDHSEVQFSHGICPACWNEVVELELAKAGIHGAPQ
jgi:phosphoserine phosphatase RsbU/P